MQLDISKRKIGLNFDEYGSAEIWLWAPNLIDVSIVIEELNIIIKLEKQDKGYWYLKTDKIKSLNRYCFEITRFSAAENLSNQNIKTLRADPAALFLDKENSIAFDTSSYQWTDQNWKGIKLKDYLIYELHTGTFTPEGTFESIISKLNYLVDLGITAIEIMPISQFSGDRNWGYDGVFPFAVQNSYGGPQQLQRLVNACHDKGLAVILDVVYNHLGPEGNYFSEFAPYFTEKHHTPWGSAINFDDFGSEGVRNYYIENALMWFRDFHIDALRLDAVHAIKDSSAEHILAEIKHRTTQLTEITGRTYYLIAESDLNDNRYINPLEHGGYGMDAQWIDEFHHALWVAAGQEKNGYYADFDGITHLAKSFNDAYVYDGQFSKHRNKNFGKPANNPGEQFVVFSQNHDQIGNRMLGERSSTLVSFEMLKLMAATVFVSPFLPLIFMGEEWAETNPFQFFISHNEKELVDAVRKGRKEEFIAFHSEGEIPDPQLELAFTASKLDWEKPAMGNYKLMLNYYKNLIALRKNNAALNTLDRKGTKAKAYEAKNTIVLTRKSTNQKIICLLNFSIDIQNIEIENLSDKWELLLDSSDKKYVGPNLNNTNFTHNGMVDINPESVLIFSLTDE
ncbi:malto-oligosyltrehalose trehalohydrolase [Pedobacter jejuensis]|uniref:Malto-oligosyltrehalose trehalohydrolase n=1 Tax=Pedobacter jejuensis TaxID=1268550 RepID=A0A3N0C146_9SPHI|nr:malto-oligosyltrehalose trehalohydrolase [Pedobacter jejuensis]RNL55784.1 malto-oligosyltrehalose trehalohydrolase [Pedobacter jejuensis]